MRRFSFGLVVMLSLAIGLLAPTPWLFGLFDDSGGAFPLVDHLVERFEVAPLVFLAHVVGGGLALLVGPWQLMTRLRARRPRFHRAVGRIYVGAVALGGSAGLVMGWSAWAGPIARSGFVALAIAWLATTAIGLQRILGGDRAAHRTWMTRSFALAFAAVSLRLQVPLLGALGVADAVAYQIVAWSSWVPNLVVAQLLFARRNSAGDVSVHRRNARVNELCSENPSR